MRPVTGIALLVGCVAAGLVMPGCTADVAGSEGRQGSGDMGSGSGGSSEQTLTLSQYFDKIAAVHCQQAFSCRDSFPPEQGVFEDTWGTSVVQCEADLIAAWDPKQVETEIAKGRITYDGAAAVTCLAGVTFAACPDYWQRGIEWAESCYHVVVGMVPVGGECQNLYSCASFNCDTTSHTCI
jgi:hypothetical protein